jgi:hypothetical protein
MLSQRIVDPAGQTLITRQPAQRDARAAVTHTPDTQRFWRNFRPDAKFQSLLIKIFDLLWKSDQFCAKKR